MNKESLRAAVIGATGYTGQEVLHLLRGHAALSAAIATSEADAGAPVPGTGLRYVRADDADLGAVDVAFVCLPHGASGEWAVRAHAAGARVVDLSADLRDGRAGAVYGLPELWRGDVNGRGLVANPGCYPTGVLLGLAPLLAAGLVDPARTIVVNAASGVTGAGRTAKRDLLFAEVSEDFRAYGAGNGHRHVAEMARGMERAAGATVDFVFTPHLLPIRRGILETIQVPVRPGVTAADVRAQWRTVYGDEVFVELWEEHLPGIAAVVRRNVVALGAVDVAHVGSPLVTVVAAFDNLVKGAAGQAIQNANLMLGLGEGEGLPR